MQEAVQGVQGVRKDRNCRSESINGRTNTLSEKMGKAEYQTDV